MTAPGPLRHLAICIAAFLLSGCASTETGPGYYWQSVTGHLQLMRAARPVQDWIDDPQTSPGLRERLELAQRIRIFASEALALPDNASYRRYADLGRRAAVYNVVATGEFSLTLKTWCFPVAGCVGYRGYYEEGAARRFAATLPAGLDVLVYPVPAYSTLGWLNWLGGDPLLNTFIAYPEGELARLIFHELAHQVLYVKDDTVFNESFATAVERLGGQQWLQRHASDRAREEYRHFDGRRQAFRALTLEVRQQLSRVFSEPGLDDDARRAAKAEVMERFRADYLRLRESWGGHPGYDAWVARANNASFAAQAAYNELVPGFEALFMASGGDFRRFYEAARNLARQPRLERHATLHRLAGGDTQALVQLP
ncbi:MAG TPA: aminopeptidase [Hydrogenophaga sp.]|uniref:aminopeptidase n=1 Tax=Hydrogenophaga sp. TaxID=1904254 RepID=UPI002C7A1296|nr:aminopeptidase [Hydrogenophaga sp.]HMN93407.1 aminopeptidase [Hydrogenophaga sp.]HMP10301.1 aminopeptidase [Hydrogenophaga sp.]